MGLQKCTPKSTGSLNLICHHNFIAMHERYISFITTALASGIVENGGAKNGVRSNAPQQLNTALHTNGLPYCTCKTKHIHHIPNKLI